MSGIVVEVGDDYVVVRDDRGDPPAGWMSYVYGPHLKLAGAPVAIDDKRTQTVD